MFSYKRLYFSSVGCYFSFPICDFFGSFLSFYIFSFLNILFMYSCKTQRGRGIGRGKMRLHVGRLMWDLIHQDPGIMTWAKADAQPLRHPGALLIQFLCYSWVCSYFIFLPISVSLVCTFLGICPFLPGLPVKSAFSLYYTVFFFFLLPSNQPIGYKLFTGVVVKETW